MEKALHEQSDYDAQLSLHSEAWRQAFHARFYQERVRLRDEDPAAWRRIQIAGMQENFSWDASAREYVKMYEKARL